MSRQFWAEALSWVTADGASVNTTAAETIVFPDTTIPGNYMQDGRLLRVRAQGLHSTLGSGTVTAQFRIRWGGVAGVLLCTTGAIVQVISLTNAYWELDALLQTRTNGSAGTIMANGWVKMFGATVPTIGSATGAPAVSPMTVGGQTGPAVSGACDLTVDKALSLTVQMGASSGSNIIVGKNLLIEALN